MKRKLQFRTAQFLGSMLSHEAVFRNENGDPLVEIALVGKSNVGKSSLINHLLQRKTVAHTSSRPGKTTTINFYNVDDGVILVDLPGYGYAKRGRKERRLWSDAVDHYLNKRSSLKLLLLLMDCRRPFSQEDEQIIEWAHYHQKSLFLIFTKSDTIEIGEKKLAMQRVLTDFPETVLVFYSIRDGSSRNLLISEINTFLQGV